MPKNTEPDKAPEPKAAAPKPVKPTENPRADVRPRGEFNTGRSERTVYNHKRHS